MCTLTTGKDIPYYIYARAKEKDDGVNGINGKDGETTGWGVREGGFHGRRGKAFCQEEKMFFQAREKILYNLVENTLCLQHYKFISQVS